MKKIYQSPKMTIVKLHTVQMIAASQLGVGDAYQSGNAVLSRQSSVWGDVVDEEE